jgi:hypothetical protein
MTYPSLLWSNLYNKYLALGTTGGKDKTGWSFQLSDDLVHWSSAVALDTGSLNATGGPGGNTSVTSSNDGYALYAYPSLLDPTSTTLNYDTIDTSGYIYLMGRRTPLPQHTNPRSFYVTQDVLRLKVEFESK